MTSEKNYSSIGPEIPILQKKSVKICIKICENDQINLSFFICVFSLKTPKK